MKRPLTKTEAERYRKRWEAVNAAERRELRATPMKVKFLQLAALMASAKPLASDRLLAAEEAEVRDRQIRQVLRALSAFVDTASRSK